MSAIKLNYSIYTKNLAEFMKANNIPGADYVYTGKTGGIKFFS